MVVPAALAGTFPTGTPAPGRNNRPVSSLKSLTWQSNGFPDIPLSP